MATNRTTPNPGTFVIRGLKGASDIEVLDEARHLSAKEGGFTDDYKPYEVHLYRVRTGG